MDTIPTTLLVAGGLVLLGVPWRAGLRRLGLPPAVSLLGLGIVVGPEALDLVPEAYLGAGASTLSRAAFAVLLVRAGLGLAPGAPRAVLGPALLMGTLPVAVEGAGLVLGARLFAFEGTGLALLFAFLIVAVSPAVILPSALEQQDAGRGAARRVPDRVIGQTVVNAFVAQTGILFLIDQLDPAGATGPGWWPAALGFWGRLPLSVAAGIALGAGIGALLPRGVFLGGGGVRVGAGSAAALLAAVATYFGGTALGFETVFATLSLGVVLRRRLPSAEPALRRGLREVWSVGECLLFANLGMSIRLSTLTNVPMVVLLLVVLGAALAARLFAADRMLRASVLTRGEARYVALAQLPKATIQAVFGAEPLLRFQAAGLAELVPAGEILLVAAVLAICVTAPLGAVVLDRMGARLLAEERTPANPGRPPPGT